MSDPAEVAARLQALRVMDEVGSDNPLGREAAALIERLVAEKKAAEAENAKLRRALQEMADAYRRTGLDMSPEGRAYLAKIDTLIGGDDA